MTRSSGLVERSFDQCAGRLDVPERRLAWAAARDGGSTTGYCLPPRTVQQQADASGVLPASFGDKRAIAHEGLLTVPSSWSAASERETTVDAHPAAVVRNLLQSWIPLKLLRLALLYFGLAKRRA